MTSKHTPTPWHIRKDSTHYSLYTGDPEALTCGTNHVIYYYKDSETGFYLDRAGEAEANAKHIVHCVNTYNELVKALEDLIYAHSNTDCFDYYFTDDAFDKAKEALALAKGKQ